MGRTLPSWTSRMRHARHAEINWVDWSREPLAWLTCVVDALPLSVTLVALWNWLVAPLPATVGLCVYLAVFTAVVAGLKPWARGPEPDHR